MVNIYDTVEYNPDSLAQSVRRQSYAPTVGSLAHVKYAAVTWVKFKSHVATDTMRCSKGIKLCFSGEIRGGLSPLVAVLVSPPPDNKYIKRKYSIVSL